jgi:hypothetical protein
MAARREARAWRTWRGEEQRSASGRDRRSGDEVEKKTRLGKLVEKKKSKNCADETPGES